MLGAFKVCSRVPVGRAVATADVTTLHAEAQVHPLAADSQTVFTTLRTRRDLCDLIQVCTTSRHLTLPSTYILICAARLFLVNPLPLFYRLRPSLQPIWSHRLLSAYSVRPLRRPALSTSLRLRRIRPSRGLRIR